MPPTHAPYDGNGNLQSRASQWDIERGHVTMRPVAQITTALTLLHVSHGKASVHFTVADSRGHTYPMFICDLHDVLRGVGIAHSRTPLATWVVVKRGNNYGIKLAEVKL